VIAARQRDQARKGGVILQVVDQGAGIPADGIEHIFEPFFTTRARGTGLGLAISRKIVEAHGGSLTAESREGEGATFVLWLPAHR
jgi:signal transduction histidine kinase